MEEPSEIFQNGIQIVRYSPVQPCTNLSPPWLDLRMFYVRLSNLMVDDSTPEVLTLNHIPLSPDTLLEVNGIRSSMYSEGASSFLRRDRMDKKSEEATFVSTDNIRLSGTVKFEVYDKEDLVLSGVLEMCGGNGFTGESKSEVKRWNMNCEAKITAGCGFLKGKLIRGTELPPLPIIEVYVAGCFSGMPIILTKTMQLSFQKKQNKKGTLDTVPETTETETNVSPELDPQEYDEEHNKIYWRTEGGMDGEDGELSWFNAGVRVGVGISLGICVGVGIGTGLLVSTYQATTRNFRLRFL